MTDTIDPQSSGFDHRLPLPSHADEQMELMLDIDRQDYRFALEQASDIICRTNLLGRITFVNPAATRILGYSKVEILGHYVTEFIREDYRSKVWWFYARQFLRLWFATFRLLNRPRKRCAPARKSFRVFSMMRPSCTLRSTAMARCCR
jgi:PAS domain-containing protein